MKVLLLGLVVCLGAFAQTTVFTVATGTQCSATVTSTKVDITCTYQGASVMTASIQLPPLIGNGKGFVIGFNAQDNVTMLFKRQATTDPLTVQVSVNDKLVVDKTVPIP